MKKLYYKAKFLMGLLLSFCLILSILFVGKESVLAINHVNKSKSNSYVFVLKEGQKSRAITQDIEEKYETLKIESIDEINTIIISSSNHIEFEQAKNYLNSKYTSIIEESGKEEVVEIKDFRLPSSLLSNQLIRQREFGISSLNKVENIQESESNNFYDRWRWDIDKVTSNGDSYKIQEGNHEVKIAIVDSGIDYQHPDLKNNIIGLGKSFVPDDFSMDDEIGHGTMVAGTIASNGNIKGIAPRIGIVPYKVFKGYSAESSWIIKAIIEAANDDMDVINLSLGTYKSLKDNEEHATYLAYQRAISYADKKGSLLVASSGTDGYDLTNPVKLAQQRGYENDAQMHMPGGLPNVITVSATTVEDDLAFYSNFGRQIHIAAPAGDYGPNYLTNQQADITYMTLTTYPTALPQSELGKLLGFEKGYELMIGTSLAAPKVSATAALIIAEYKDKFGENPSPMEVKRYLYQGASVGKGAKIKLGAGIVNAKNSLNIIGRK